MIMRQLKKYINLKLWYIYRIFNDAWKKIQWWKLIADGHLKNMCCDEIGLSMCPKSRYHCRFKSEHVGSAYVTYGHSKSKGLFTLNKLVSFASHLWIWKSEMTISMICICQLCSNNSQANLMAKMLVKLEVPMIWTYSYYIFVYVI